jgi:hypothetical protein
MEQVMKKIANVALLIFLASVAMDDELSKEIFDDWEPADITPESLNVVLGEVTVNGPLVTQFEFTPYRSGGTLDGCGYSYSVLMKDWAYRSNQPIWISGSRVYFAYLRLGDESLAGEEDSVLDLEGGFKNFGCIARISKYRQC